MLILCRLCVLLAVALPALVVATAAAAPLSGVLATDAADGPIAAYSNTAAWNRWDEVAGGFRIAVDRGGKASTLNVAPSQQPFELSAGRGPGGATWLVWSRCDGNALTPITECDVEAYDFDAKSMRSLPFAARPGVIERVPSVRDDRLVYVVSHPGGVAQVHLADIDGSDDRVIDVLPPSTCDLSLYMECFAVTQASPLSSAIRGDRVAVSSRVSTGGGDFGICGLATVRLLHLRTSAVRTLDDAVCGLSGRGCAT